MDVDDEKQDRCAQRVAVFRNIRLAKSTRRQGKATALQISPMKTQRDMEQLSICIVLMFHDPCFTPVNLHGCKSGS